MLHIVLIFVKLDSTKTIILISAINAQKNAKHVLTKTNAQVVKIILFFGILEIHIWKILAKVLSKIIQNFIRKIKTKLSMLDHANLKLIISI